MSTKDAQKKLVITYRKSVIGYNRRQRGSI